MRKITMVKKRKCFQNIIAGMYCNARFTCNFLQLKYSKVFLINFLCGFLKTFQNEV